MIAEESSAAEGIAEVHIDPLDVIAVMEEGDPPVWFDALDESDMRPAIVKALVLIAVVGVMPKDDIPDSRELGFVKGAMPPGVALDQENAIIPTMRRDPHEIDPRVGKDAADKAGAVALQTPTSAGKVALTDVASGEGDDRLAEPIGRGVGRARVKRKVQIVTPCRRMSHTR